MSGIAILALAVAAFVGTHLLLSHPLRAPLVARMGEGAFLGLYSGVAAITLGLVWWARRRSGDGELWWVAGEGGWLAGSVVMLLASILLMGSMRANPAFPNPRAPTGLIGDPRGVFAITRHPMNWSFALWSIVHFGVWASAANLVITAGILVLAIVGSAGQDAKKSRLQGQRWRDWMARTSFVPFAGQLSGRIPWQAALPGWRATMIGVAFFLAVTWVHAPLGMPGAGPWRWIG